MTPMQAKKEWVKCAEELKRLLKRKTTDPNVVKRIAWLETRLKSLEAAVKENR